MDGQVVKNLDQLQKVTTYITETAGYNCTIEYSETGHLPGYTVKGDSDDKTLVRLVVKDGDDAMLVAFWHNSWKIDYYRSNGDKVLSEAMRALDRIPL